MKILHTSDLHLTEESAERWSALEELVQLAIEKQVSILVIAGDLFDQESAAEILRSRLRKIISAGDFHTIILPGNHDYRAYRSGLYFGENVTVLNDWEKPYCHENNVFWGLPYEKLSGEHLINRLKQIGDRMNPKENNFLIYHGELLDAFYSRHDLGDEGDQRYMPAKLSYFESLPVKYILAGHFHSRCTSWQLSAGGLFIYSGSPVAVTRRETGLRVVNLIGEGEQPVEIPLRTYHFEDLQIMLDPFDPVDPLELIEEKLCDIDPEARLLLKVRGFINSAETGITESELAEKINEKVNGRSVVEAEFDFLDIQHIIGDDIYKRYSELLLEKDYSPEFRQNISMMVIRAFREVKLCS